MKSLPYGMHDFATLINDNYVYVDKTQHIFNLYKSGARYFFLSRPRRFGKSLLLSTLKELFQGNQELFKDLWISKEESFVWRKHPVILLDMAIPSTYTNAQDFTNNLREYLQLTARSFNIDLALNSPKNMLHQLIFELYQQYGPLVILIDEYDKPLLNLIDKPDIAEDVRTALQSFYEILKSLGHCFRTLFITGVTKFNKTSIFSGLNNLLDISFTPEAATLLGYTKKEIQQNYHNHLESFSQKTNRPVEALMQEMQEWYNGYRFSEEDVRVFNPFSVLSYLIYQKTKNYWFESGTPTFLLKFIKDQYPTLLNVEKLTFSESQLSTFDIKTIPLDTILFQTGYLTIKSYNSEDDLYTLGFPNKEVEQSFHPLIIAALTNISYKDAQTNAHNLLRALKNDNLEDFFHTLKALFAHIPHHLRVKKEAHYHALLHFLGVTLGAELNSEIPTNKGRADMVITIKTHTYIFEFKHNATPEVALKQIEDKKYYERYLLDNKKIVLIGVSFDDTQGPVEITWKADYL